MLDHEARAAVGSPAIPQAFKDRLALLLVRTGDRVAVQGETLLEARAGITGRDYTALAVIAADSPSSQQELARLMGKAPAMAVGLLDDLEAAGLVARGRDPKDRRRSIVTLTPEGERKLAEADTIAAEIESQVIDGLTAKERDLLLKLLGRTGAAEDAADPPRARRTSRASSPA